MLRLAVTEAKIEEINNRILYMPKSIANEDNTIAYIAHLNRLKTAYEKERLKAIKRMIEK